MDSLVAIAGGVDHRLFLNSRGELFSEGENSCGQLGIGKGPEFLSTPVPYKIPGLSNICSISSTWEHSLALTDRGLVYSWGNNFSGQLGIGTAHNQPSPKKIKNIPKIIAISAGKQHSLLLSSKGEVFGFGSNECGEISSKLPQANYLSPVKLELPKMLQIAVGDEFSAGLAADYTVWIWGDPVSSWRGGPGYNAISFKQLTGLQDIQKIAAGDEHLLLLGKDGSVSFVGRSSQGELFNNKNSSVTMPRLITSLSKVQKIATGPLNSYALDEEGQLYAWGFNLSKFQFENTNQMHFYQPTPIQLVNPLFLSYIFSDYNTQSLKPFEIEKYYRLYLAKSLHL